MTENVISTGKVKPMSLKEVARVTGLSIPTVGNVLGRSAARYSAATRKKVVEATRQLGYKPNSSARRVAPWSTAS